MDRLVLDIGELRVVEPPLPTALPAPGLFARWLAFVGLEKEKGEREREREERARQRGREQKRPRAKAKREQGGAA